MITFDLIVQIPFIPLINCSVDSEIFEGRVTCRTVRIYAQHSLFGVCIPIVPIGSIRLGCSGLTVQPSGTRTLQTIQALWPFFRWVRHLENINFSWISKFHKHPSVPMPQFKHSNTSNRKFQFEVSIIPAKTVTVSAYLLPTFLDVWSMYLFLLQ